MAHVRASPELGDDLARTPPHRLGKAETMSERWCAAAGTRCCRARTSCPSGTKGQARTSLRALQYVGVGSCPMHAPCSGGEAGLPSCCSGKSLRLVLWRRRTIHRIRSGRQLAVPPWLLVGGTCLTGVVLVFALGGAAPFVLEMSVLGVTIRLAICGLCLLVCVTAHRHGRRRARRELAR